MSEIKKIKCNPTLQGMVEVFPDIVFSRAGGEELKMQIISPWWERDKGVIPAYPAVVFVQGSGWTFPNVWMELPQLCELARKGYVVATITHRNAIEGHPYPACIQDVKTAIRFLRKHAKDFGIAAGRIGLWGTSSGANLSLLTAMTMGDVRYMSEEHAEYSDAVDYVAACFPTTDFVEFMKDETADQGIKDVFTALSGGHVDEDMMVLKEMSPYYLVKKATKEEIEAYPPMFIAHGDSDELIPHRQSLKFYEALEEVGADATMVTVEGAPHEGSFWSREMLDLIFEFIEENS